MNFHKMNRLIVTDDNKIKYVGTFIDPFNLFEEMNRRKW